ncbi:MAG TPA: zinc metalloprotease HtpX [Spirochaetota bacterium]|nr:zinc metalloprotease HtpX [Spirochaetota bacterium]HOL56659.1 zinc metalloprotease HtpX [Spirochaetota bacterium]HPP05352.1 zinc metalloprotease HtpX [Spirochaetota bacterium]
MFGLHFRLYFLLAIFGFIVFIIISIIGTYLNIGNLYFYIGFSLLIIFIQYLAGPKIVEIAMRIKYITREENPQLYDMVKELSENAKIKMPKVAISEINIPNAFAFGYGKNNGSVCVTIPLMRLLNKEELKAVLGHEISHLKNNDVLFIMILSVIPMILYAISRSLMWGGSYGRRRSAGNVAIVGLITMILYFITNLLVLYGSRIREYFADLGSIKLGSKPEALASALYKLVYGAASIPKEELKSAEGFKAFFASDPSLAYKEIRELSQIDLDGSGHIDRNELDYLKNQNIKLKFSDRLLELLSTHPNMLKRIKSLSKIS